MAKLTCALGPDSAGTLVTGFLSGARSHLDCAVYEVGPAYRWLLTVAARRGVRVRLLLDAHAGDGNRATAETVLASGGECRVLRTPLGPGHWKLLLADTDRVAVGSGNLIWRDAPRDRRGRLPPGGEPMSGTREWWVLVHEAPSLRRAAAAHFERAWDVAGPPPDSWALGAERSPADVGAPPNRTPPLSIELPEERLELLVGGPDIAARLGSAFAVAHTRLLVTAPYVHAGSRSVLDLLYGMSNARTERGVDVRLLLGLETSGPEVAALRRYGVPTAVMDPARSTAGHAKGAVIDSTVVIGSANWSRAGLAGAWEAALAVTDVRAADYYARSLLGDWSVAVPLPNLEARAVSPQVSGGILGAP